jgi:hypothetical protein
MARGGMSASGRVLRWWLWKLPVGATKYSIAKNTAVMTEEGRRWLALLAFGFWAFLFWRFAQFLHGWLGVVVPLRLAALFGLLLIWRIVGHLRRLWVHRRHLSSMARNAQVQRQTYEILTALPGQIQQLARNGITRDGGGFTMFGSMRQDDPGDGDDRRQRVLNRQQVLDMLPEGQRDLPLGDEFEPVVRMPKWMRRRRKPKGQDEGGG